VRARGWRVTSLVRDAWPQSDQRANADRMCMPALGTASVLLWLRALRTGRSSGKVALASLTRRSSLGQELGSLGGMSLQ